MKDIASLVLLSTILSNKMPFGNDLLKPKPEKDIEAIRKIPKTGSFYTKNGGNKQ